MYSGKVVKFEQRAFIPVKLLNSGKSGCVRAKVFVFGQKWLYSGKRGCIRAKVIVFG